MEEQYPSNTVYRVPFEVLNMMGLKIKYFGFYKTINTAPDCSSNGIIWGNFTSAVFSK